MIKQRIQGLALMLLTGCLLSTPAKAAYVTTGWLDDLQIDMDNGVTYFRGFTTSGNCLYDRLELRESGDYFSSVDNGRRMYAAILAARLAEKPIKLGYNDTDDPNCPIAEVWVDW